MHPISKAQFQWLSLKVQWDPLGVQTAQLYSQVRNVLLSSGKQYFAFWLLHLSHQYEDGVFSEFGGSWQRTLGAWRLAVQEYSPDAHFVVYVFRNLSTRQVGFGIGGSWQRTLGAWRLAVLDYSTDALFEI
jgi:hypothetical protein